MKPFTLPTAPVGPAMLEPLNLCLYGPPGIGKTPICATLPDAIYLDLQRGTLTYTCRRVDVMAEAEERSLPYWQMFEEAAKLARAARPKFLIVDTIGDLADWADAKALARFKESPMGKDFDQPSILDLPGVKGSAGFGKLWDSFQEMLSACMGSWHRTIFIGHPKDKIAFAVGTDPNVKQDVFASSEDLDLTGKMRRIFTSKMAAIGYMKRDWEGKRIEVYFQSRDSFSKTRCPHLVNALLTFSNPCTLAEWARIYPNTLSEYLAPEDREKLTQFFGAATVAPASAQATGGAQ